MTPPAKKPPVKRTAAPKDEPEPEKLMDVLAEDDTPEAPPVEGALVDPEPVDVTPTGDTPSPPVPKMRVRIVRAGQSVPAAGAHYTLRAGTVMNLDGNVAEQLIRERYAIEV